MILALIVVLAVSAVVDLALGAWASASWESFAGTWFHAPAPVAGHEPQLLGLVLGLILIFFAAAQFDTIRGIRQDREGVYRFPILFGGYLFVSSVVTFLVIQSWNAKVMTMDGYEFLLMDGLRGGLLVTFGLLAMRAPATVRELRLPKQAQARADRVARSHERGSGPRRGRDGGRRGRSDRSDSRRQERRSARKSTKSKPSAPVEAGRPSAPDAGGKDRSLSVVVKGEFRSGSDRDSESAEGNGSDAGARDGRRRRRRRGGTGRRSTRGGDAGDSSAGTGSIDADARLDEARAVSRAETSATRSNGTTGSSGVEAQGTHHNGSSSTAALPYEVTDLIGSPEGVSKPVTSSGSGFGRGRRPASSRRR
ncbi:MAG: hypothetical protein R3E12_11780 [Candidatus Eisenbacteria bacterium]|uniref:Uncharacterized protein n=1 Tax=Eiseniibacteriota bacterium TaxID=2212470 RepID=A0A956LZ16_UNCEI|nr:hypothetical protein [Candidatus Eisenbacteria bacterium]